jgi:hypothetical protein
MKKPEIRCSYAVKHGFYAGEILIFIRKQQNSYEFLSIPKMLNRSIPCDKFNFGWDNGIIDFVEMIPKDIYKVVTRQFENNSKSIK